MVAADEKRTVLSRHASEWSNGVSENDQSSDLLYFVMYDVSPGQPPPLKGCRVRGNANLTTDTLMPLGL